MFGYFIGYKRDISVFFMEKTCHHSLHINRLFSQVIESDHALGQMTSQYDCDMELSLRPQDITRIKLVPVLLYGLDLIHSVQNPLG